MTSTHRQFSAGTVDDGARDTDFFVSDTFDLAGKKSGHGAVTWLPAPDYDMPQPDPWQPGSGGPVIALLDSAVAMGHPWLPPQSPSGSFVTDAKVTLGWPGPDRPKSGREDDHGPDLGSHLIHGTFIAGLIRQHAPKAGILSLPVMNIQGKVDQADVISALAWLTEHAEDHPVDIVLMAFGTPDLSHGDLAGLKDAMSQLGSRRSQVQFVASAGNHGSDRTVYPAAFAADPDLLDKNLNVASVGAVAVGTPTERARYSNYGPWVTKWRNGTNIISLAPLTTAMVDDTRAGSVPYTVTETGYGYAWWSGTSFAAALYAAEVAKRKSPAAAAPEPAAGS